jgi:hypothetical protein
MTDQNNNPHYRAGDPEGEPYMSDIDMLQAYGASGAEIMAWAHRRVEARKQREEKQRMINEFFNGDQNAFNQGLKRAFWEMVEESREECERNGWLEDEDEYL